MKRKHSAWHYVRKIAREVTEHPANADHKVRALARAVGWQVRKRVLRKPVDIPYEGLTLRCHPDSGSAGNIFYFTSRYDWDEMAFLERYLRPGDGFLDIGANIGTYSLLAASLIGRDAHIEAFEPLPVAAERVRENFALNHLDHAVVHEIAVDDHEGTAGFLDFDVSSAIEHDADTRGRTPIQVVVDRIDARATGTGYAFAKLDVEGVELRALEGARALIERHDPPVWQIEILDHQLRKHGSSAEELVGWMADAGFTPAWYEEATGTLTSSPDTWRHHPNCLFVADDRLAEVEARLAERPAHRS